MIERQRSGSKKLQKRQTKLLASLCRTSSPDCIPACNMFEPRPNPTSKHLVSQVSPPAIARRLSEERHPRTSRRSGIRSTCAARLTEDPGSSRRASRSAAGTLSADNSRRSGAHDACARSRTPRDTSLPSLATAIFNMTQLFPRPLKIALPLAYCFVLLLKLAVVLLVGVPAVDLVDLEKILTSPLLELGDLADQVPLLDAEFAGLRRRSLIRSATVFHIPLGGNDLLLERLDFFLRFRKLFLRCDKSIEFGGFKFRFQGLLLVLQGGNFSVTLPELFLDRNVLLLKYGAVTNRVHVFRLDLAD